MAFLILTIDRAGHVAVRDRHRAAHYAYLIAHEALILAGGGLQDDAASLFTGGLLLIDVQTRAEAEAFATADPFAQAGLFAETRIVRWKQAFPRPAVPPAPHIPK